MNYIDRFNNKLLNISHIKIVELSTCYARLSNGRELVTESEVRRLKRRIGNNQIHYLQYFDNIYGLDLSIATIFEKKAKAECSSIGGKSAQQKHGDRIRLNLNNGVPWNKELAGNYPYSSWAKGLTKETDERIKKLSEDRKGSGNPMYGIKPTGSQKMKQSEKMKQLILDGKFTPNSNNRNTHWDSTYKGKKYRSSWEALCQYVYPEAKYEELRITYNNLDKIKVYIVDFVDHVNRQVIEVKPKELQQGDIFKSKMESLYTWANEHEYKVIIFDREYIKDLSLSIDYSDFCENTVRKIKGLL